MARKTVVVKKTSSTSAVPLAQEAACSVNAGSVCLKHEQIAHTAKLIWQSKGCIPGQDAQNWHEAETQLKAEL